MRRWCAAAVALVTLAVSLLLADPAAAAKLAKPGAVTSAQAYAGSKTGEIKVRWQASGAHTDRFQIETALTPFGDSGEPTHGRNAHVVTVGKSKRSLTLSAGQVQTAGAAPQTGNHLYVRVTAVNTSTSSPSRSGKASPLVAAMPRSPSPAKTGVPLRIASFNVRSAYYGSLDPRTWLQRAPDVAKEIVASKAGIVAIQELSSGRADGLPGDTSAAHPRMTESLASTLAANGGRRYLLVRKTAYNPPGTPHGSQAARILYDSSRYALVSSCPDVTGTAQWSSSCSIELPILPTDAPTWRRSAAYAEFADLATGSTFLVVSAHLDYRQSTNPALQKAYDGLRKKQAATIAQAAEILRGTGEPVIVAGDLNSSQADAGGYGAHDYLVAMGYYDTVGAQTKVNLQYPTLSKYKKTLTPDPQGFARRIDDILVAGVRGAARFEIVTKKTDPARTSDHSMIYADVVLPRTA